MSWIEKLAAAVGGIPTGASPFTAAQTEALRRVHSDAELDAALAADTSLRPALDSALQIEAVRTALAEDHAQLVALVGEASAPPDARRFAPDSAFPVPLMTRQDRYGWRLSREAPPALVDRVRGKTLSPDILVVAYPHGTDRLPSLHNSLHARYVEGIREAEKLGIPSVVLHDSEWSGAELAPLATALVQSPMGEWVARPRTNHAVFAGGSFREGLSRAIRSMALMAFHRGETTFAAELVADAVWTYETSKVCLVCTGQQQEQTQPMTLADLIQKEGGDEKAVAALFRRWLAAPSDIPLPSDTRVVLIFRGNETILRDGRKDRTLRLEVTDHFSFMTKDGAERAHHFARLHGSRAFAPTAPRPKSPSSGPAEPIAAPYQRVATHDGSLLQYRLDTDPKTKRPVVVFEGELSIVAEMTQRLAVANAGMNVNSCINMLFPFNRALQWVRLRGEHDERDEAGRRPVTEFANGSVIRFRHQKETGLYEATYFVPDGKFVRGIGNDHTPPLDPEKVASLWQLVLKEYLADPTYERTLSGPAQPKMANMNGALAKVVQELGSSNRHEGGSTALSVPGSALIPLRNALTPKVWSTEVGVRIDRRGKITAIVVKLYDNDPGMWGDISGLQEMSGAEVWTGRPSADGKGLEWSLEHFDARKPSMGRMLGTAMMAHVASGGEKTTAEWQPPATYRPMPGPMDEFSPERRLPYAEPKKLGHPQAQPPDAADAEAYGNLSPLAEKVLMAFAMQEIDDDRLTFLEDVLKEIDPEGAGVIIDAMRERTIPREIIDGRHGSSATHSSSVLFAPDQFATHFRFDRHTNATTILHEYVHGIPRSYLPEPFRSFSRPSVDVSTPIRGLSVQLLEAMRVDESLSYGMELRWMALAQKALQDSGLSLQLAGADEFFAADGTVDIAHLARNIEVIRPLYYSHFRSQILLRILLIKSGMGEHTAFLEDESVPRAEREAFLARPDVAEKASRLAEVHALLAPILEKIATHEEARGAIDTAFEEGLTILEKAFENKDPSSAIPVVPTPSSPPVNSVIPATSEEQGRESKTDGIEQEMDQENGQAEPVMDPRPRDLRVAGMTLIKRLIQLASERGLKKSATVAARLSDKALASLADRNRLGKVLDKTGYAWAKGGLGPWGRKIATTDLLLLGLASLARSDQEVARAVQKISGQSPDAATNLAPAATLTGVSPVLTGARNSLALPIAR